MCLLNLLHIISRFILLSFLICQSGYVFYSTKWVSSSLFIPVYSCVTWRIVEWWSFAFHSAKQACSFWACLWVHQIMNAKNGGCLSTIMRCITVVLFPSRSVQNFTLKTQLGWKMRGLPIEAMILSYTTTACGFYFLMVHHLYDGCLVNLWGLVTSWGLLTCFESTTSENLFHLGSGLW